jgi:dipeptidyl aminopeptidase/acylaminoacyl peptidase
MSTTRGGAGLRRALLAAETHTHLRLSPDGRSVAFVRTAGDGQQLWLRTVDGGRERLLADRPGRTLAGPRWTPDGSAVLYRHAPRGREFWQLAVARPGGEPVDLPAEGSVTECWTSAAHPSSVAYSVRDPRTGRLELLRAEPAADRPPVRLPVGDDSAHRYHRLLVDGELCPRGGVRLLPDGATELLLAPPGVDPATARPVLTLDLDETSDLAVQRFSPDGGTLYLLTGHRAPTRRLLALDTATGAATELFAHPRLDVESYPIAGDGVWFDPGTGRPDLCATMGRRLAYHPLTDRQHARAARLAGAVLVDRGADDRRWLVVDIHDDGPIAYRVLDPDTGEDRPVLVNRPALAGRRLPGLTDLRLRAADGRELSGYLMRPLDSTGPLPTVVLVHGGPAGRDLFRLHAEAHYLASLGFASVHLNYRGSRGFGRAFRLAGNGEWGGLMQQDLYDAVAACVRRGVTDPDRVAFMGSSYGGYAALLAACTRPELVRCAVALSPPCDLVALVEKPPAYWQPLAMPLRRQILGPPGGLGPDPAQLRARSPQEALDGSCAPLLLAHGARDPRVPVAEVDRFAKEAITLGVPVRYLRFPDEGHHITSDRNRAVFFAALEEFLEAHLARH